MDVVPLHDGRSEPLFRKRSPNIITSLYLGAENLERVNLRLQAKLARIKEKEQRSYEIFTEDAEYLVLAFGTIGRVCQSVVQEARDKGIKAGLPRPISLWPFSMRVTPSSCFQASAWFPTTSPSTVANGP